MGRPGGPNAGKVCVGMQPEFVLRENWVDAWWAPVPAAAPAGAPSLALLVAVATRSTAWLARMAAREVTAILASAWTNVPREVLAVTEANVEYRRGG